ncbi:alpha/beta fold hydrolase [Mangrovicella endophytica]|uniref:alpha/beta fold hydrolase n=1 Tax=Mangrovicella endophytica TaxID=2066697 RepID=UPI0012FFF6DF|nr:alpha/beta hydrolase [Mangrovicella endophytica]
MAAPAEDISLAMHSERDGRGEPVILLPALSTISTRGEMRPLMRRLAQRFEAIALDWPAFGTAAKTRHAWTPDDLSAALATTLAALPEPPAAIVAAGHACAYALRHCAAHSGAARRLVLIAPTWRGPFPTMLKGRRPPWLERVRRAVDLPVLGSLLYRLNVSRPVVARMTRAHVYEDSAFLNDEALAEKAAVMRAKGARHASVRFVTGGLDPVESREAFLALAERADIPILVVIGAATPPKSRAEMEALAALPGVETVRLPHGRLSVHEEFPDAVASAVLAFLAR